MIQLIWFRELRDQLRDRRTVFMIVVLPLILYPVLGAAVIELFSAGLGDNSVAIGVQGSEHLPPPLNRGEMATQLALAFAAPSVTGVPVDRLLPALAHAQYGSLRLDYPALARGEHGLPEYFDLPTRARRLRLTPVGEEAGALLDTKEIDLILVVPPGFSAALERGERPTLETQYRQNDERSRLAGQRLLEVLSRWRVTLREVRLRRHGLTTQTIDTFEIRDPEREKSNEKRASEGLFNLLLQIFPFLLVMWSLAGALYPAVDVCAGEKERGTMETLLISPAGREEIVWGKFLTIWVFSAATALLNLVSMGVTMWRYGGTLTQDAAPGPETLFWCVLLLLPLSAFFSALCLSMGAYARSTKEGQYYLMPLFLVTMPLVFLTLAPGVELNAFYSLVPVTGVALLLRRLMESSLENVPWLYFIPVLAPVMLYSWMALRWAIEQFKREEVLFREAERLDLGLWLRRLFREKEAIPTVAQALFCFALVVALRWSSFSWGGKVSHLTHTGVTLIAFVAAPTLLMAVVLTTRPLLGLALRGTRLMYLFVSVVLAVVLIWPMAELTMYILERNKELLKLLNESQPLVEVLRQLRDSRSELWWYSLILALLPALSEELLFRGFLLTGLRRRFRPWMAVFLSSLLFGLYHLNVFQFVPSLILGMVLGLLTIKSGSVLPAMLYHLIHNGVQVYLSGQSEPLPFPDGAAPDLVWTVRVALTSASGLLACGLLIWLLRQPTAVAAGSEPAA